MEWVKCSERMPISYRLLLLFVDEDYEFGRWQQEQNDFYIYTGMEFKKRHALSDVTHFAYLSHPVE